MKMIGQRERFGSHLGLERIGLVCAALGNPQNSLACIHVAGTNGKGSVSAMLAEVLRVSGFKVGLFTSPHLEQYGERFRINGKAIDLATLNEVVEEVERACKEVEISQPDLGPVTEFEVTLAGLGVQPGEVITVPESGYGIGQGYAVLVLYADTQRITLKYTGEDSVVNGYTVHVEGVCVEPNLLALYGQMNAAGRRHLPALRAGQALGRARSNEIQVAIRDTGRFMDPRTRKDWWRGR